MASIYNNYSKIGQIFTENIDDLIFILDNNYRCEYINFRDIIPKKEFKEFIHPNDNIQAIKLLKNISKFGFGIETLRIKYEDKPFTWFEIKGRSFVDSEDNTKKIFLVCRENTKFKNLEFELKKSQARFDNLADSIPEIQFWKLLQTREGKNVVQQTREMLELVFDNIPQIIYWKDTNLSYLGCNKNFAFLNNIDEPASIIGMTDKDLIWLEENLNIIQEKEIQVIKTNKAQYNVIESLKTVDGKENWFEINRVPLHDSKENVVGILVTYEDITIRRIAEVKLKESEEKYRGILENIVEGYFEVDLNGNFTFFNEALCELINIPREELLYTNYQNFVDEENKNKIFKVYREVYKTGKPISNFNFQFHDHQGKIITSETSIHLRYNSEGNKIGFSGLARDITEKFSLEQKLKESEKRYRHLFESSPYAIWLMDENGTIVDCNPAMTNILSVLEIKDLIGKKFFEVLSNLKRPEYLINVLKVRIKKFLQGEKLGQLEFELTRMNGTKIWISIHSSIVKIGERTLIQAIIQDITEKKNVDQKIKDSETKYRHLFQSSPYSIILINRNGKIVDCNPATEKLFNRKIDGLINKNFLEIDIKPENAIPLFKERYQNILKGDVPEPLEIQIARSKDQSLIWISIDDSLVEIGGEYIFQVIIQDITGKKLAEQELKKSQEKLKILNRELEKKVEERTRDLIESEQQYRTTIDSLNDSLHVVDSELRIMLINQELKNWLNELGIETDILGKYLSDAFPFLPGKVYEEYREVFETGKPLITVETTILPNYDIITETRKIPIFSESQVSQIITIIRDITESKKIENQLKESEKSFRNMITNLDEGYYKVEWEGKLIYHNPTFSKIAGYGTTENFIGKDIPFSWENKEDRDRYQEILFKNGIIRNYIVPIKKKDDQEIVIQMNAHLIKDENDEPIAVEGTFSDITDKFRLEQELLESERKLRLQNIELKKLDKVKNDFITMAAHELKTPLISISGYTDYILMKHRSHLNPEITTDLLIVQRNVNRLEVLMDQLLDVLKIDENELKLQKETTNVSKIINDCLDELSYLINEKNLEIIFNVDLDINLNVDPNRIFSVFANLISNAIKFTPDYGWIEVYAKKEDNYYLFEVKDNGIGLVKREIDRLFKKFERIKPPIIDDHINIKDSGTGLGLYITKGIIEAHDGKIWASSDGENKGSTFSFTLPK
ncbi:MAG: PAS domain S-box protein [Candidatus Thorarchaeota archaeon]